jgi:hypothetical protein
MGQELNLMVLALIQEIQQQQPPKILKYSMVPGLYLLPVKVQLA